MGKKLFMLATLLVLAPSSVLAAITNNPDSYYGVNDLIQQGVRLGNKDLRTAIAGIINVILGFLGVIAVIGVLYGGFMIMTSQGDADRNGQGRLAVTAGVIGLAIVLAAFAISSFVLNELYNATR